MSTRISSLVGTLVTIGAVVVGGALLGDGTANADALDNQFLDFLSEHGIEVENPAGTIAEGRAVCGQLDDGVPFDNVVNATLTKNPGLSTNAAGEFIGAAVGAYCPANQAMIPG